MNSAVCATNGSDRSHAGRNPSPSKAWVRALELTASISQNPQRLLSSVIEEWAEKNGDSPALLSRRETMSYRELAQRSNQCTRWALGQNLQASDTVCLLMSNRPEYMAIWLGIARAGCTVALINTNLTGPSLAHSIDVVAPKHVIVASEFLERFQEAQTTMRTPEYKLWVHGAGASQFDRFDETSRQLSSEKLRADERRPVTIYDRALCIYTSGTTGLPKAANISHARLMQWSLWFAGMLGASPDDRLYNCLPMYHSVGGTVATGAMLAAGGSVALRENFSAGQFWNDIVEWDCTLFQYIGELCRYLLQSAPNQAETEHRIRMCCGNGLRPDIWEPFQSRFRVGRILEFYGATEGNVSFFNAEGKPGAIGKVPPYLAHRFPAALVRLNPENDEPVRDSQGLCVRTTPNEPGEAIGRIANDQAQQPGNRFEGYTNEAESEKKILRNVFEPGDAWFRTGDLMRKDEQGYYYFVDRMGETFRWKGENVSTSEVTEAICRYAAVRHASVYGVTVPGADGRAGMATVVCDRSFGLPEFRAHLYACLPEYAHPLFLRLSDTLEVTGTFKYSKATLIRQGYNPAASDGALYFHDRQRGEFVPLDAELHERLQTGQVRL